MRMRMQTALRQVAGHQLREAESLDVTRLSTSQLTGNTAMRQQTIRNPLR